MASLITDSWNHSIIRCQKHIFFKLKTEDPVYMIYFPNVDCALSSSLWKLDPDVEVHVMFWAVHLKPGGFAALLQLRQLPHHCRTVAWFLFVRVAFVHKMGSKSGNRLTIAFSMRSRTSYMVFAVSFPPKQSFRRSS